MSLSRVIVVALTMLVASSVSAQDQDPASFVPDVQSSQILFRSGLFEHNPRFTVSGRGDDIDSSYAAGNRQTSTDASANLQLPFVNNFIDRVIDRVIERVFLRGRPNHTKAVHTIGWIARSAVASYVSYRQSAGHF